MADEKIISLDNAREKINNSMIYRAAEEESPLEAFRDLVSNFDFSNTDIMAEIATMVALPDKEFALIAPLFLEEFEKIMSQPGEEVAIAQMFNAAGIKADDLINNFDEIMNALDEQLKEDLNVEKRTFIKKIFQIANNAVMETETVDKRYIRINYEKCHENAQEPTYAHSTDAGMDIYAIDEVIINPGETVLIPTGIKMEIPKGYAVLVHPRSGLSLKSKLRIANSIGLIDADYRGEIKVIMENTEPKIVDFTVDEDGKITSIEYGKPYIIGKGEKFAQLRLVEIPRAALTLVDKVNDTERAEGGFGSTGA